MAYSFTEKKRIRKDFGKRPPILDVPYLLSMQLDSFRGFLQADVPVKERTEKGLHGAFTSVFPIVSYSGHVELQYVNYSLGKPVFDVKECQLRGLTYAAPLRVTMRLAIFDKEAKKKTTPKAVKEQEVYMGELPLMTDTGTFVINGAERVIDIIEDHGGLVVCMENCTGVKPILEDVDADADESGLRDLVEDLLVVALAILDDRSQHLDAAAVRHGFNRFDDLLGGPAPRRMTCDVEVNDGPLVVPESHKAAEDAEVQGYHWEEVDRRDRGAPRCQPSDRGRERTSGERRGQVA